MTNFCQSQNATSDNADDHESCQPRPEGGPLIRPHSPTQNDPHDLEIQSDASEFDQKAGDCPYDRSVFDHTFQGYSVWIEPDVGAALVDEQRKLVKTCGGPEKGVHDFVPHVTLLYNVALSPNDEARPIDILERCRNKFLELRRHELRPQQIRKIEENTFVNRQQDADENPSRKSRFILGSTADENGSDFEDNPENPNSIDSVPSITPYDWFYFLYPKAADQGRGFGCSITMLLIEPTTWLQQLHEASQDIFGSGERSKFIPHVSLVYAPEEQGQYLEKYTQDQRHCNDCSRPCKTGDTWFRVRYLSLWSTQGSIDEWLRVAKLPLMF